MRNRPVGHPRRPRTQDQPQARRQARAENRDGQDLIGRLIHWAAHAATGKISAGAEGRYHSRDFGDIAEHLGLKVKEVKGLGFQPVADSDGNTAETLTPLGLRQFRSEIRALDKAMTNWEAMTEDAIGNRRNRSPVAIACQCTPPRLLRATTGVALGPGIRCEKCGALFTIRPGQRGQPYLER